MNMPCLSTVSRWAWVGLASLIFFTPGSVWLRAQTSTSPNEGLSLVQDSGTGALTLSWWGRSGHIYFVEHSQDLDVWEIFPDYVEGTDAPLHYGALTSAERFFARVRSVIASVPAFEADDYDQDGLTTAQEVLLGLNPFMRDTDEDGLPDGYETAMGLDPLHNDTLSDLDGDGVANQADARPADPAVGTLSVTILTPL